MEALFPQLPGLCHNSSSEFLSAHSTFPKVDYFLQNLLNCPPRPIQDEEISSYRKEGYNTADLDFPRLPEDHLWQRSNKLSPNTVDMNRT
jgi:hypothetical protein